MTSQDITRDRDQLGIAPKLRALLAGGPMSQAASVAAELRIPDLLADGPKHVVELAASTGSHVASLHRLLRALASIDLCIEREDGSFGLTAAGDLLRTDTPNSLRSWAVWCGSYMWPVWGNLSYSVKTGESAERHLLGTEGFEHLARDSKLAAAFNQAMADLTRMVAVEVAHTYDFTGMNRIVDVGGGYGGLLAAILKVHPRVDGVLLDLPHAIEGARAQLIKVGLEARCQLVGGDFFQSVPGDGDAYLLKAVIHDWDDERSIAILRNCRRAIAANGRLLLIERVVPERMKSTLHHQAIARADLIMLLGPGGRERTEAEFRALLDASDFELANVVSTALEFSILEAIPR